MLLNIWESSAFAALEIGISEEELSKMREKGFLRPGKHWKSAPNGQEKPWNPKVLYNIFECKKLISKNFHDEQFERFAA